LGLAYAVWGAALGYIDTPQFPVNLLPPETVYSAQSPSLFKLIEYDEEERWKEVERLAQEVEGTKFSVGQQLYYQVHLFANPRFLWKQEYDRLIEEFTLMETFHIPLAKSLDEAPAQKLRDFQIIKGEIVALQKHTMEKQRGSK
jgi:hypothetical protein|tara:strand:+ start:273 stop:704 length:432 start_codon:yes stop_codon:yes gene_type:complete